jgi:hypothetical protein
MAWTSDDLDTAVRRDARIPDGSSAMSASEVLAIADEETLVTCLPLLLSARAEHMVRSADYTIASGQASYRIPTNALAAGLRDVTLRMPSGAEVSLPQIPIERRGLYEVAGASWWPDAVGYCVQGDAVVLLPTPAQAGYTLRLRYHWRPGRLVPTTSTSVYRVASVSGFIRFYGASVPTAFSTSTPVDVVEALPNFDTPFQRCTPASVTTGAAGFVQLDITDDFVSYLAELGPGVAVTDLWIALAGYAPVVQLPDVMHPLLAAAVVARVEGALGRRERMAAAMMRVEAARERVLPLLGPRNEGEPELCVNWHSPLRAGRWR